MHLRTHRVRPNEVTSINQAPALRTPEGHYKCRFCAFSAARKHHYNRHITNAHLRKTVDENHHNTLWSYALEKKVPGTAYYEAKRQREEAAVRGEIEEMEVLVIDPDGEQTVQQASPSNIQPSVAAVETNNPTTSYSPTIATTSMNIQPVQYSNGGTNTVSLVTVVDANHKIVGYLRPKLKTTMVSVNGGSIEQQTNDDDDEEDASITGKISVIGKLPIV